MQQAAVRELPQPLAVCGWDTRTPALVRALADHGGLRAVAVGDQHASQLVRAREHTGLPCYQHLREMLRAADYRTVLLQTADDAEVLTAIAADRDARLLVLADQLDGPTLAGVATAAASGGGILWLLRPLLRDAGLDFALRLAADDPRWRPYLLTIELEDDRPAAELMRDGVALASRLLPSKPSRVVAAAIGPPDSPWALSIQLRCEDGRLATMTTRSGPRLRLRLSAESDAGRVDSTTVGDLCTIAVREGDSPERETKRRNDDLLVREVRRVTRSGTVSGSDDGTDARLAPHEAAVLSAIDSALRTGQTHVVDDSAVRSTLRVLQGTGSTATPPSGRLRLVAN